MVVSLDEALREARLAVEAAREVRAHHRKRTERGNQQREDDLRLALERVKNAMKPLRSEIGRFSREAKTAAVLDRQEKIRAASASLQRERRKLWKMQERT